MTNKNSTSGAIEDMVRSFVHTLCAEMHTKTLVEMTVSEYENITDADLLNNTKSNKEVVELNEQLSYYMQWLDTLTAQRREDMNTLYKMAGSKGNKKMWCNVKHCGVAAMTAFEAWQATDDENLYEIALAKNDLFLEVLTAFLGMPITNCASCFSDMTKAIDKGESLDG